MAEVDRAEERTAPEAPFQRLPTRQSLAEAVVERLSAEIDARRLAPGAKLPTERELMAAMGVSRTVVREAVAALRAEGRISTRQGLGAFVTADAGGQPFRLKDDPAQAIRTALEVMELRTGVEVEAAGLAAERATAADIVRIEQAYADIAAAIDRDELAVDQDFGFHCCIAAATGNPQFRQFLQYLGRFIIPRQSVRYRARDPAAQRAYLRQIQGEHRRIADAIAANAAEEARAAMRLHLGGSLARYRSLTAADATTSECAP